MYDDERKTHDKMFCLWYGTLVQIMIGENPTLQGNTYVLNTRKVDGGTEVMTG